MRAAATEELAASEQLSVHFKSDNRFKFHGPIIVLNVSGNPLALESWICRPFPISNPQKKMFISHK